jgi:hypothetical protein
MIKFNLKNSLILVLLFFTPRTYSMEGQQEYSQDYLNPTILSQVTNPKKRKFNETNTLGLVIGFLEKNSSTPMTIDQDKTNINDQDEVVESESKKQKEDDVSSTPQSQEESFVNSLFNEDFFNQDDPEVGDILPDPEQLEQGIAQDYNQFVEKRGKKFICTFEDCIRNFAKRKDCEEHVITTHFNKPFICTKCNKTYHSSKRYYSSKK